MKYKTFKNKIMKIVAKNMNQWWISQSPNSFNIRFKSGADSSDFFIWSKKINYEKDFLILGPKLNRTIAFDDVFNIYPVELFNHKYGICFELKNGSSFIIGK